MQVTSPQVFLQPCNLPLKVLKRKRVTLCSVQKSCYNLRQKIEFDFILWNHFNNVRRIDFVQCTECDTVKRNEEAARPSSEPVARLKIGMCCVDVSNTFLKSQLVCFLPVEILTRCSQFRLHFSDYSNGKVQCVLTFLTLTVLRDKLPDALHRLT